MVASRGMSVEWQMEKVTRPATGKRVLLIDDDADVRRLIACVLSDAGYEVDSVETVAAAMAHLRARRYDLVVADAVLGDGNGMEVADAAKAKGMRVIILTGHARAFWSDLRQYQYLSKPLRPAEMVRAVDAYTLI